MLHRLASPALCGEPELQFLSGQGVFLHRAGQGVNDGSRLRGHLTPVGGVGPGAGGQGALYYRGHRTCEAVDGDLVERGVGPHARLDERPYVDVLPNL